MHSAVPLCSFVIFLHLVMASVGQYGDGSVRGSHICPFPLAPRGRSGMMCRSATEVMALRRGVWSSDHANWHPLDSFDLAKRLNLPSHLQCRSLRV